MVDATLASLEPQIQERSASIVDRAAAATSSGDARLLAIVLENLVSNALKYGPRTGGRVEISAERRADRWRVSVSSGGMPIPAEEAERIFEPFHRVPGERRVPGIGLGLTICARLMERLDGAIGVEPGAEAGNTFWIDLRTCRLAKRRRLVGAARRPRGCCACGPPRRRPPRASARRACEGCS